MLNDLWRKIDPKWDKDRELQEMESERISSEQMIEDEIKEQENRITFRRIFGFR